MIAQRSFVARIGLMAVVVLLATGPASAAIQLFNNAARVGLWGTTNTKQYFYIDVPAGTSKLVVKTWSGLGDADLYLRKSRLPTTTTFLSRSVVDGNVDQVTRLNPSAGRYYIMIHAYRSYSLLNLRATTTAGTSTTAPYVHHFYPPALGVGGWQYYYVDVAPGRVMLRFELYGGIGDADLYWRHLTQPTTSSYAFASRNATNCDGIQITSPQPGRHWLMVYGYSASSGSTLRITLQ
jgi:serine protease